MQKKIIIKITQCAELTHLTANDLQIGYEVWKDEKENKTNKITNKKHNVHTKRTLYTSDINP